MVRKKDKTSLIKEVESLSKELLKLMSSKGKIEVSEDKENDAIRVDIESDDEAGLLIGTRGETLNAIQIALGMMIKQKTGEWKRIIVNVGDWREKQEEHLKEIASQVAERAIETDEPQTLYNLKPSHRRIVHMALKETGGVKSESFGEGEERYLVVTPEDKSK